MKTLTFVTAPKLIIPESIRARAKKPQIPPLRYALSKNIPGVERETADPSTSLRFGRDDKGEGLFITLGGLKAHENSGRENKRRGFTTLSGLEVMKTLFG